MPRYKYAIVIGASSGIGQEITKQLAAKGCKVAAVARRKDVLEEMASKYTDRRIKPFAHDVTCYEQVPGLFQEITRALGGLDLVVYASGAMPEVGWHEYNFEKDQQMVEVNLLGAVAWLNQAAIRFENTKHGTIVGIGSVAGDRGRGGQPVYNTTKAALATYLEALRNRLARFGVKVVTIKPGPTETPMTAHLKMKGAMSAEEAARLIIEKSDKTGEHYLKPTHRIAFYIIKRIPSGLFRKLKI
jgi:decaprenylphospho-beta-D-erythro-pentofuranosid-2-ulose 2-reductase